MVYCKPMLHVLQKLKDSHVLQVCVVDLLHSAMAMLHLCFLEIPSFAHFAFFLYT